MTSYSVIPLIALLAYIPLLALVLRQRPWQREHKLVIPYLIAAIVWGLASFLLHSTFLLESKVILVKALFVSMMWMVTHYYHFARSFGYKPHNFGLVFGYGFTILFAVLAALGYMPKEVSVTPGKPLIIEYGLYIWLLALPMLTLTGILLYSLIKKLSICGDPTVRNRISYLLISIPILMVFFATNLVPFFRGYPIDQFGNLINACILTYATLRYELVSMKDLTRRGLVYSSAAVTIAGFYLLVLGIFHYVLNLELAFTTVVAAIVISGIALGGFWYSLQRLLNRLVDRFFYGERLDHRETAFDFSRHARSILGLKEMGKEVTRLVAGASGARSVYLFLPERKKKDFVSQFFFPEMRVNPKTSLKMRHDSPIIDWLNREGRHLRREEIDILPEFTNLWQEERKTIDSAGIELFMPLIARGKLVAVLALTKPKKASRYDIDDLKLLQFLSAQAATMIDNAQLYTESKEHEEDLRLISRLSQIISSSLDTNEIYEKFAQELRKVMDADWTSIALIDKDHLRFLALTSLTVSKWKPGETITLEGTATAYIAKTKRTFIEKNLAQRHKFWTGEIHLKSGIRSIVYVPLLSKGEVIGSLIIGSFRPNAYEQRQISLLEQIAAQIAMTIENSKLYEEIKRQAIKDELTGLFNRRYFEQRLNEEIDRHSRYGGTFSLLMCDLDFFKNYNDTYGHRAGDKLLYEIAQLISETVRTVDLVFRYGGDEFVALLPQTTTEEAYYVSERIRSQVESEMQARGITVTTSLGIASWPGDGVTVDEIVRASDTALYHAKQSGGNQTVLFSETISAPLKNAIARVSDERTALSTVHALVAAVDAKDHYTSRHSQLVATYATALARAAGLSPDKTAILRTAALLHDVGKIGIPDELLNKTGKLTAEEWETLQSHSRLGVSIISHVPSLAPCLPIILHHHEHYDGMGYPKQLKGETTSLEARILAVADAFAAMTTARPYRRALSYKEAIAELKQAAGTQFDPELIELFIPIALSSAPEEAVADNQPNSEG